MLSSPPLQNNAGTACLRRKSSKMLAFPLHNDAGFSAKQCRDANFSAEQFLDASFSARQCRDSYFLAQCKVVGFQANDCKGAGFSIFHGGLEPVFSTATATFAILFQGGVTYQNIFLKIILDI